MFVIALLAILGAVSNVGVAYWIVYGLYCFTWLILKVCEIAKKGDD